MIELEDARNVVESVARIIAPDLPLDTPTLPAPGDAFPNLLRRAFGIVSAPPAWGLRVAAAIQAALHACGASLSCMGAFGTAFMVIFVGLLVVQLRGAFGRCFAPTRHWAINAAAITFTEILSSATGALVVLISANAISKDPTPRLLWHAAVFGPPVLLLAFSAAGIAQVGLLFSIVNRNFAPGSSRACGTRYSVAW